MLDDVVGGVGDIFNDMVFTVLAGVISGGVWTASAIQVNGDRTTNCPDHEN